MLALGHACLDCKHFTHQGEGGAFHSKPTRSITSSLKIESDAPWRSNYSTLAEHADKVIDVMEDQARRGVSTGTSSTEPNDCFPRGKSEGHARWNHLSSCLVRRDQERAPIASDLTRSMREEAAQGLQTFALTGQCRGSPQASAYFSSVNPTVPALIVFFILCGLTGVPLSWSKTAGGDVVSWVGFELLHRSFKVGISARRAEWFSRWSRDKASSEHLHIGKFEEGLGRIMYVAGALEFERPFFGPLYKFMSLHPRNSVRRVPSYVTFILTYLDQPIQLSRHCTQHPGWTRRRACQEQASEVGSRLSPRMVRPTLRARPDFLTRSLRRIGHGSLRRVASPRCSFPPWRHQSCSSPFKSSTDPKQHLIGRRS